MTVRRDLEVPRVGVGIAIQSELDPEPAGPEAVKDTWFTRRHMRGARITWLAQCPCCHPKSARWVARTIGDLDVEVGSSIERDPSEVGFLAIDRDGRQHLRLEGENARRWRGGV